MSEIKNSIQDYTRYISSAFSNGHTSAGFELLCDMIEKYASRIYVRDQIAGVWGSYALTELSAAQAIKHTLRFVREKQIPFTVIDDDEKKEESSS